MKTWLRALALVLASGVLGAQSLRVEMSFKEALERAESAPDVVVARAAQAVAESAIAVAKAPAAPTFNASHHTVTARLGFSLSVPLRWAGQRGAAVDVARAERDAALFDAGAVVDKAREAVTAAWFRLAADEELEKLSAARVERLDRTHGAVKELFDAGRVPRVDLVKADAELATARAEVFGASAERRASSAALAFLLGYPPTDAIVASGERPQPAPVPALAALLVRAEGSAELRAAEARGRAAAARVKKARREGFPALTLEGGADFHDPTQEGTDKHLSLGLTIPIGAGATVGVSRAELEKDAAERAKLLASIESEVVQTWHRVEAARLKLEALDTSTLPATREAAELARVAYREGRLDLLRLIESERALLDVEATRIGSWATWGTERASLERLVGGKL